MAAEAALDAFQSGCIACAHAGNEPAGADAEGAQAVQDGALEAGLGSDIRISVHRVPVAAESIQQCLAGHGVDLHHLLWRPLRDGMGLGRRVTGAAAAAIVARKRGRSARGNQLA